MTSYDARGRRSDVWHAALTAVLEGRIASGLGDRDTALAALVRAERELAALRPVVAKLPPAGHRD